MQPAEVVKEQKKQLRMQEELGLLPKEQAISSMGFSVELTPNQEYRQRKGWALIPDDQICEWCKGEIKVMCQKGTGVCSQRCAKMASNILYSTKEKAEKFGGGYSGENDASS